MDEHTVSTMLTEAANASSRAVGELSTAFRLAQQHADDRANAAYLTAHPADVPRPPCLIDECPVCAGEEPPADVE